MNWEVEMEPVLEERDILSIMAVILYASAGGEQDMKAAVRQAKELRKLCQEGP